MKYISSLLLVATLLSCGSNEQTKAVEKAKESTGQMKPGAVATSPQGYSLKATVNGNQWAASSMMPPDAAGRIIGYQSEEYIGLPFSKSSLAAGTRTVFGEEEAVDLALDDDVKIYAGKKGGMEITKNDGKWAEGKFYFTATSSRSAKTIEVTDGFFRIPLSQ